VVVMGGACNARGKDGKCEKNFGLVPWRGRALGGLGVNVCLIFKMILQ
jgi:hypothetical protein